MAATKNMTDIKLQVIVENGTTASGKKATKTFPSTRSSSAPQTTSSWMQEKQWQVCSPPASPACDWSIPMTLPMQDKT